MPVDRKGNRPRALDDLDGPLTPPVNRRPIDGKALLKDTEFPKAFRKFKDKGVGEEPTIEAHFQFEAHREVRLPEPKIIGLHKFSHTTLAGADLLKEGEDASEGRLSGAILSAKKGGVKRCWAELKVLERPKIVHIETLKHADGVTDRSFPVKPRPTGTKGGTGGECFPPAGKAR